MANCSSEGGSWGGPSSDIQSGVGTKPSSPHSGPAGPTPSSSSSSSSSSSTSVLPPSSSPPHTPPPSFTTSRDARESSPDSQTVDSSCKTPEPSFLSEDCPAQTQSTPNLPPSSPTSVPSSQGGGISQYGPSSIKPLPLEEASKSLIFGYFLGGIPVATMTYIISISRAKAQEFIHATSQILSQTNQNHSSQHAPSSSSSSQVPPPGPTPAQFILHNSLPMVGCTKTTPSHLHPGMSMGGGCYLKKLHTQERAVEEVKLAIKPYYQRKDINKDDYKDILRKAVHKICHSRTGEINPVKVSNLVKLYVQRYKYFRKHGRKMDEEEREDREMDSSY
uniref:SFR19-like C-terminal domain-containing protein n=1 Tax=Oncorhynchus mykiss TaxID=8022 RepID=A0A8C7QCA9_ONCMY